ncbi:unnamed protein product [Ambrosiozyma monospora]|uniref:Unnamed protein product n=1 Tax=Ambrosiozyma monospora TaxID=43982 RepID=A0ACB5T9K4_AMBMO|nr:unnamed protein product [Ambrosiozyma monospora]
MKLQFYFAIIAALSNVGLSLPAFPSLKRDSAGYVVITAGYKTFSNFTTDIRINNDPSNPYDGISSGHFLDLEVGSNSDPVSLLVDTGSADMVFTNSNATCLPQNQNQLYSNQTSSSSSICYEMSVFDPSDSTTFKSDGESFLIEYADGSQKSGVYATDNIKIGDIEISNLRFGLTDETTGYGVFGVGGKYLETDQTNYDNFPFKLKSQNYIKKVTTTLGLENDTLTTIFGGVDHCKYDGGLTLVPLYVGSQNQNGVAGQTGFTLNSISFGDDSGDDDTLILSGAALAFLDTGNPVSRFPQAGIDVIAKSIDATFDETLGLYLTDCSVDSHLTFNFQGVDITLPLSAFIGTVTDQSGEIADYCVLELVDSQDPPLFYFGLNFHSYAYVITDLESDEVAIAPFNAGSSCEDLEAITSTVPSATSAESYSQTFTRGDSLTPVSATSSSKASSSASCRTCSNINISTSTNTNSGKVSETTTQTKSQVQQQTKSQTESQIQQQTKPQITSQLKPTVSSTASSFVSSFLSSSTTDNLPSSVSTASLRQLLNLITQ